MPNETTVLRHKDVWSGVYRHVSFEIVRRSAYDGKDIWNYYLILPEEQIPEALRENAETLLSQLEWHGGMTYYVHYPQLPCQPPHIKAGCDYNHSWDEDMTFNLECLHYDVRHCIDSLHAEMPIRCRCKATGLWFDTAAEAGESERQYFEALKKKGYI